MKVYGPDGRVWQIARQVASGTWVSALSPRTDWFVEARASEEVRHWQAASWRAAGALADEVALALRTGGPSPAGEVAAEPSVGTADPSRVADAGS